ncbi:LpqB family beta-propeller domain-containing protein [Streptomyces scabiei]|nr:LpqB family beta-propeller domain-containing protein [Streptomyces scabiei]MDX2579208.1 LpqB family beta-propeller domain-containing protein [Streptomyces scabiei]MDX2652293.1 LpqB family beta-propeller domain-containing protein [Streptomyces scabiei]MDX2723640.1 LpqB family beta-propeller domain-containing protein [Streptomyces scabiei]MDX2869060.1 LpqB family beta-propeller domain-containing protein [Streptomyces scabiei]MDX2888607.1 LpqB family beta-propeller domain-containing protein [S
MGDRMQTLAYGDWPSPIDAALAAAHDGQPEFVGFVGDEVWWTEPRPAEGGRRTLVRRTADGLEESVLPAPWNVRSRVMEYGGLPWAGVMRDDGPLVVFVNHADQRLYRFAPGGEPVPLTPVSPVGGGLRWADPRPHPERDEVWCVLEEFTGDGPTDVRRVVAAVPLDGSAAEDRQAVRELTDDTRRFVSGPRLSPDGRRAAWLAWDHPGMPWDGTSLLVAEVTGDGRLGEPRTLAGGPEESVAQAEWAADGTLIHSSDTTGYWNLYRLDPDSGDRTPLCAREEEFGGPLWKIGWRWFALMDDGLAAVVHGRGATALGILDLDTGQIVDAAGPWTEFAPSLAVHGSRVIGIGASPRSAYEVVELDAATGDARVIGAAHDDPVDPTYYPEPQIRSFLGPAGREIHAHVYPPHHPGCVAFSTELPPYVIWAHGGPTSRAPLVLDLAIAYFTSRGIGVAEVNYGGSTGYGREYRNRLREQWGVVDVEDCAAVALALADEGTADRTRLAVRGGSAGGWTAAVSLTTTDVYACGTILYPILDLTTWASGETHDFESQYLESLVGPLAQEPMRYVERSPSEHADRITAPFLLLQGLDDVICPPAQCERFLARMQERRVPHAYIAFEGEGHGFRRAETTVRVLEAELSLYAQVFGLNPPAIPTLELTK